MSNRLSLTHPICMSCYSEKFPHQSLIKFKEPITEKCCICNTDTTEGIYIRIDPNRTKFPMYKWTFDFFITMSTLELVEEEYESLTRVFTTAISNGYIHIKLLPDGRICGIVEMLYTFAVCVDLDVNGCYENRYCYHTLKDAFAAYENWKGENELTGWHRKI